MTSIVIQRKLPKKKQYMLVGVFLKFKPDPNLYEHFLFSLFLM